MIISTRRTNYVVFLCICAYPATIPSEDSIKENECVYSSYALMLQYACAYAYNCACANNAQFKTNLSKSRTEYNGGAWKARRLNPLEKNDSNF